MRFSLFRLTVVMLLVVAAVATVMWQSRRGDAVSQGNAAPSRTISNVQRFRDASDEVGIGFRMSFLSAEQGEHFKSNLYDHGTGVVVGDYNGDGHDDIYFLNQLGLNQA